MVECREFITSVQVDKVLTQMRGTACLVNNEWEVKGDLLVKRGYRKNYRQEPMETYESSGS